MKTTGDWGKEPHRLWTVEEAWSAIAAEVAPLPPFAADLSDAVGCVLAAPIAAGDDYPAFDKAMMDGFAVRCEDCAAAGAELRIGPLATAGGAADLLAAPGIAVRINTGAPVPQGADAVVPVERTFIAPDKRTVRIDAAPKPGQHVERRGSIRRRGDAVLTPPLRLGPAGIAAAATAGAHVVHVHPRPGAAVVTTGDELVPVGRTLRPGRIHDSNGPMLHALLIQFGARPTPPLHARDDADELTSRFDEAMRQPIVVAAGGMSMGTHDLVPQVLSRLGVRWLFHGVSMRPGKPVAYGRSSVGQHVFGLPGNPVSAFVCAWLFIRMVVDGLQGLLARPPARCPARLARDLPAARDGRMAFVPARVRRVGDELRCEPCRWHGSSDPFGLAEANALLIRPNPAEPAAAGQPVDILLLDPFGLPPD